LAKQVGTHNENLVLHFQRKAPMMSLWMERKRNKTQWYNW